MVLEAILTQWPDDVLVFDEPYLIPHPYSLILQFLAEVKHHNDDQ